MFCSLSNCSYYRRGCFLIVIFFLFLYSLPLFPFPRSRWRRRNKQSEPLSLERGIVLVFMGFGFIAAALDYKAIHFREAAPASSGNF